MTRYVSVRLNWHSLLHWHLKENGTRADGGPEGLGKIWSDAEFAFACNVGDARSPRNAARTVQNWLDERAGIVTPNLEPIEKALMGNSPAYAVWRRDLRVAHRNALQKRKEPKKNRKPTQSTTVDEPINTRAFTSAVMEGLLMRLRGRVYITPDFFHQIWMHCCDPKLIAAITDPELALGDDELLLEGLLNTIVIAAMRRKDRNSDELAKLVSEANYHVRRIFLEKLCDIDVFTRDGEGVVLDVDAHHSLVGNLLGRLPDLPQKQDVNRQTFESWKDLAKVAIACKPNEDKRYVDILAPFLYAISFDKGPLIVAQVKGPNGTVTMQLGEGR